MNPVVIRNQERRSWSRVTMLGSPTDRFIGKCAPCVLPMGVELPEVGTDVMSVTVDCRLCGDAVTLSRVYGTVTSDSCDGTCMGAVGPICGCGCGGKNHGKWFSDYVHGEVTAEHLAAVERYQATTVKRAETARVKRERKAEVEAERLATALREFHDVNREIIDAMYAERENDNTLNDMLSRFEREAYLSARTLAYAESIVKRMHGQREREAREAAKLAEREARGVKPRYAGTVDGKLTVTGIVTVAYDVDNGFGAAKMIVIEGTGPDEGVTVKWVGTAKAIWSLTHGDTVTIAGTVKDHKEYNGTPQTVITRCKVTVHEPQSDAESIAETAPPIEPKSAPEVSVEPSLTASGRRVPTGATADPSKFPAVWLREGESIQAVFLPGPHGPRRCGDGHGFSRGACGKEVVQIHARLSNDFHYSVWRHADGTPGHGDHGGWRDCEPVWQCPHCGSEDTAHCPKCHTDGARVYTQEAWGDRHTCTACDRNDYYSIGD